MKICNHNIAFEKLFPLSNYKNKMNMDQAKYGWSHIVKIALLIIATNNILYVALRYISLNKTHITMQF